MKYCHGQYTLAYVHTSLYIYTHTITINDILTGLCKAALKTGYSPDKKNPVLETTKSVVTTVAKEHKSL
jgi:hypothetical protein